MSLLEQYEHQYSALVSEITSDIGRVLQQGGYDRRELCLKIDSHVTEALELLEQMGLEERELSGAQRQNFISRLNCYQVELKRLQNEYRLAKNMNKQTFGGVNSTIDLGTVGDDSYDDISINDDQRQRLLENSERIERTGTRLTEGYRIAVDTEAMGVQVLNDLSTQRETLQGARARLRETNADLGRASRTVNSMMLRALREKAVLYGVGSFFVIAVVVTLYLTFSSSTPSN